MSVKVGEIWDTVPGSGLCAYLQGGPDLQGGTDLKRGLALTWLQQHHHEWDPKQSCWTYFRNHIYIYAFFIISHHCIHLFFSLLQQIYLAHMQSYDFLSACCEAIL